MNENKHNAGFLVSTVVFCIAVIVSLPLRTFQYFTHIRPDGSGFFDDDKHWCVLALYAVMGICVIIAFLSALIFKKDLGFDRSVKKRPIQGVISIITALLLLVQTAMTVIDLVPYMTGAEDKVRTAMNFYLPVAGCVFGVLSAIYFVVFGMSVISGSSNASEYKIISFAPGFYIMVSLISLFNNPIAFTKVSDLCFRILMLAFMLMFFCAFAQLNSKIESKGMDWMIVSCGIPAALLALVNIIPKAVAIVFGKGNVLFSGISFSLSDIGLALFTLSVVFSRIGWTIGNADKEEEQVEAPAENEAEVASQEISE